jgi:hypothetical protein
MSIVNLFCWLLALKGMEEEGDKIEEGNWQLEGQAFSGIRVSEKILIKAK